MKSISRTSQFKKDVKRMLKRGCDFSDFNQIIQSLAKGEQLDRQYHDHSLGSQYKKNQRIPDRTEMSIYL